MISPRPILGQNGKMMIMMIIRMIIMMIMCYLVPDSQCTSDMYSTFSLMFQDSYSPFASFLTLNRHYSII